MTPVFLVDRVNVTSTRHRAKWCCPPSRRTPDCTLRLAHTTERFDIARVDTGKVLVTDATWIGDRRLPVGALWWSRTTELRPSGPADYSGHDREWLDRIRESYASLPPEQRLPPCPGDPTLPSRRPSSTFTDGPNLWCMLPGEHQWNIDGRASNCGKPYDYEHRCWVRHGEPGPGLTVDKAGLTCPAGGGSISVTGYHGFLTAGFLTNHLG